MIWPADRAAEAMCCCLEVAPGASRELALTCAFIHAPPAPFIPSELRGRPVLAVAAIWTGDPEHGNAAFVRWRALQPMVDTIDTVPYTTVQQWFDEGTPHGRRYHLRSEWLGELDRSAVGALIDAAVSMSSPLDQILVRRLGGAIADVDGDATAFRFRDAAYLLTIASGWDIGPAQAHAAWTRKTWERLRPWSCGGSYVNHLAGDEGRERVREAYGAASWDRLVALKRRMDPSNVFHLNQNIDPN